MKKPSIILLGAGGHARACIDVIERQGMFNIVGLVANSLDKHQDSFGYKILGGDKILDDLSKQFEYAHIAIGQIQKSTNRRKLYCQLKGLGFQLPAIIAPTAYVSPTATIGNGTIVMHHAVIGAGVEVGKNCIVNNRALLDHDCHIADNCHISTGAILNGNVRVKAGSFVGSGVTIKEGILVGTDCLLGMGLSIRHNIPDSTLFKG